AHDVDLGAGELRCGDPRAILGGARRLRRCPRPAPLRAAPDLARRPADSRSRPSDTARAAHLPADAEPVRCADASLARDALAGARLMARKTSFYYSFLVLPAGQRRAIIAVWDFCRAVDDAIDEDGASGNGLPTGRAAVAFWREELARI